MSFIIRMSGFFPPVGLRSGSGQALRMLGAEPSRYMGMAACLTVLLTMSAMIICLLLKVQGTVAVALGVFAGTSMFLLHLPRFEFGRKVSEMEAAIPMFLRTVGIFLDTGIPFERALELASRSEGSLAMEMRRLLEEVNGGISMQKALWGLASSYHSATIRRAVSQMVIAYETGSLGREMKKIGDELLALEQHRLREYSARNSLFGLLFLISSAVLPAFFLVFVTAGSFGIGDGTGEWQMAVALLAVFPLISLLILLLSKASMPPSFMAEGRGLEPGFLLPGAIFIIGFLAFPAWQAVALLCGIAAGGFFIWRSYAVERRIEDIESRLPDALFSISGLPRSTSAERIFGIIEEGKFGALSEEAAKSRRQLWMNLKLGTVLDDLPARVPSKMMERACSMMKHMTDTGSLDKMSLLAEDMVLNFQIKRERCQLFSMQKYTLIVGALIIPLILKIAIGLVSDISAVLEEPQAGAGANYISGLIPPYLVIYSILSSTAIADSEGRRSSLAVYSLGLSLLGLFAFHFINF